MDISTLKWAVSIYLVYIIFFGGIGGGSESLLNSLLNLDYDQKNLFCIIMMVVIILFLCYMLFFHEPSNELIYDELDSVYDEIDNTDIKVNKITTKVEDLDDKFNILYDKILAIENNISDAYSLKDTLASIKQFNNCLKEMANSSPHKESTLSNNKKKIKKEKKSSSKPKKVIES